jgi:hypothetical protein
MKMKIFSNSTLFQKCALGASLLLVTGSLFVFNATDFKTQTRLNPTTQTVSSTVAPQSVSIVPTVNNHMAATTSPSTDQTRPLITQSAPTGTPQYLSPNEAKEQKNEAHSVGGTPQYLSPNGAEEQENEASSVGDRFKFEFDMLKDPATGKIPRDAAAKAAAAALDAPTYTALWAAESVPGMTITPKGPTNLGGRTRALGIDVTNTNIMLAGSVSSGLFRTTDAGVSWTRVTPAGQVHNVTAIAQDTRVGQTDTWYYGSGEASGNSASLTGSDYYLGFGIWKSVDKGVTWSKLASTAVTLESFNSPFDLINRLVVDPTNGNVYAANGTAIYRSTDGGTNWGLVLGTVISQAMTDIIVTPTGRFYAAFAGSDANEGIYTSTTGALGTWTKIAGTIASVVTPAAWNAAGAYGRIVLAYAPSSPNIVYALYAKNGASSCAGTPAPEAKLFKYDQTAGAGTWTDLSANLPDEAGCSNGNDPFAVQGGYDLCVAVKPNDVNTVFIGGTNVYRSTSGFTNTTTTTRIGGYANTSGYAPYLNHHSDIHTLVFATGDNNTLYTGDDGGIQKGDITATTVAWTPLNNNYVTYQFYHVDIVPNPLSGDIVIGGAQDNGTTMSTTGTDYSTLITGDGVSVGFMSYTNSTNYNIVAGFQNGPCFRLTGPSFFDIRPAGSSSIFVTYYHLDPDNTNHLYYAGGNIIYRTSIASTITATTLTGGPSLGWQQMTGAITGNIRCMATARDNAYGGLDYTASNANRRLYFGTESGKVYRLNDPMFTAASTVPVDITPAGSSGLCSSVSVNPVNFNEILVTFSNYGVASVYHTTNANSATPTWSNVEGPAGSSVELASARSSVIIKSDNGTSYMVGTSTGLYEATTMSGATTVWTRVGSAEINYALVSHIRYRTADNKIAVGTHGNGMFLLGIPGTVLPIELLSFDGKNTKEGNKLAWATATERDVDAYEVQRSYTGEKNSFETIGSVKPTNSTSRQNYDFLDEKVSARTPQYYRLKVVEKSASKAYFTKIITLEPSARKAALNFVVAPNPVANDMQIVFDNEPLPNFTVDVMDLSGRVVRTQAFQNFKDKALVLPMSNLASGTYLARIVSASGSVNTVKFFKF